MVKFKNLDKIDWKWLSYNPKAIPLLEKNLDKIDWDMLSSNPNAIPLLDQTNKEIAFGFILNTFQ